MSVPISSLTEIMNRTRYEKRSVALQKSPWHSVILKFQCEHWIVEGLLCPVSWDSNLGGLTQGPAIETFPQAGFRCLIGRAHLEKHCPVPYQRLISSFWGLVRQAQSTQLSSHPAHVSCHFQEVIMKNGYQWLADFQSHWCYCISLHYQACSL